MKLRHVAVSPCRHLDYTRRARWRDGEGRERSRWFRTQAEAMAFARQTESELRGGWPGIGSPLTEEEALALRRLRTFREGHDCPPSILAVIEAGILAVVQPLPSLSVAELVAARCTAIDQAGACHRHRKDVRRELERLVDDFGPRPASSLTAEELEGWCAAGGVGHQTFNHRRSKLFTTFKLAVDREWLRANPIARVHRRRVKRPEPEVLTPAEMGALLHHASPGIRALLVLQAFCGLRQAEAQRLQWKHIHFATDKETEGHIEVPLKIAKTARRRLGFLPENAASWLRDIVGAPNAPLALTPEEYRGALHRAWAGVGAGRPWAQNVLRHSFGSYFLAWTRDEARTAGIMGNSREVVRSHYAALVTPDSAREYWHIVPAHSAAAVVPFRPGAVA